MVLLGLLGNPPWSGWQKAKSERRNFSIAKFGGVVEARNCFGSEISGYELLSLATLWLSRPTYAAPLLAGFAVSGVSDRLLSERLTRPESGPATIEPATKSGRSQENYPQAVESTDHPSR